jgi:hypothetical protein
LPAKPSSWPSRPEYYEKRWLVDEYHKALETGCRLEERKYKTAQRSETTTAAAQNPMRKKVGNTEG